MTIEMVERTDAEAEAILEGIMKGQIQQNVRAVVGLQWWLFDDALQEASLAAWTRLREGYPISIATFKARQAAMDVARGNRQTGSKAKRGGVVDSHRHALRMEHQNPSTGEEMGARLPGDKFDQARRAQIEERDALRRLLAVLPARDREILYLTYWEGLTSDEVGEIVGITGAGVRYNVKRSLAKLRQAPQAS